MGIAKRFIAGLLSVRLHGMLVYGALLRATVAMVVEGRVGTVVRCIFGVSREIVRAKRSAINRIVPAHGWWLTAWRRCEARVNQTTR